MYDNENRKVGKMKKGEKPPRYGKRLKYFRIAKDVTIKELAEATNLSPSFISLSRTTRPMSAFQTCRRILRILESDATLIDREQPC